MLAVLTLAAEAAEKSKTPFEILAAVLVVSAVGISVFGITHHETFPASKALQRGLMFLMVLLVGGTMAMAVVTA
jgi:hypothetical protein